MQRHRRDRARREKCSSVSRAAVGAVQVTWEHALMQHDTPRPAAARPEPIAHIRRTRILVGARRRLLRASPCSLAPRSARQWTTAAPIDRYPPEGATDCAAVVAAGAALTAPGASQPWLSRPVRHSVVRCWLPP
eukprot:5732911-Prymnesium_polylepis.2